MNKIILIGNTCKDPEVKTTTSGIEVTSFSLAVQRDYKNAQGAYDTDFFNCIAYRGTAKIIGQYVAKGHKIACVGKLQNRSYEKDGTTRYLTEVIVESVEMLEKREKSQTQQPVPNKDIQKKSDDYFSNNNPNIDISEDDLPFSDRL